MPRAGNCITHRQKPPLCWGAGGGLWSRCGLLVTSDAMTLSAAAFLTCDTLPMFQVD